MRAASLVLALWLGGFGLASAEEETVDPSRLPAGDLSLLECDYRLIGVTDGRSDPGAGALPAVSMTFPEAAATVAHRLEAARWSSASGAPGVQVQIKRLYVQSLWAQRLGVAVYQVKIDGHPPFLVRAQPGKIGANYDAESAHERLGAAMTEANETLVGFLNQQCHAKTAAR